MSQVVKEIPSATDYPWDEWLDGKPRKLVKGEDFQVDLKGMACQCHNVARRRGAGVTVRVRSDEGAIYIQKLDKPRTKAAGKKAPVKKAKPKKKAKKTKPKIETVA